MAIELLHCCLQRLDPTLLVKIMLEGPFNEWAPATQLGGETKSQRA